VLGPRTRAILPVHYNGVCFAMDRLAALADRNGLAIVEDAAQAVACTWRGRALGTLGRFGCYSFHHTKTFSAGEGGALLVNDPADVRRAEVLHEKGTNRSAFLRGEVDKYTWVDLGSSYVMSELNAAVLGAQLAARETIVAARRRLSAVYETAFAALVASGRLQGPAIPADNEVNHHLYYLVFATAGEADAFRTFARARGIGTAFHYVPLHTSPMGRRLAEPRRLPVTESVAPRLVRLPLYPSLSEAAQARVIECVHAFCRATPARAATLAACA
jgi:dTDP-4-amino-4,6-dideoxygalactose transaminase